MFFALNQKFENRCYNIKVSGIPSGILNKLIKRYDILTCGDMISSHVKMSILKNDFLLVYDRNIFGSSSVVFGNLR